MFTKKLLVKGKITASCSTNILITTIHLTKNERLELVPVLLLSLVDALLDEHLSKTDICSVPVPQVSVLSQNWPAGQWPDRSF